MRKPAAAPVSRRHGARWGSTSIARGRSLPAVRERLRLAGEISKHTLKEQITDKLASMIGTGPLQAGDEHPGERDLAKMLNGSRETVRGAIQRLAARRMVEISRGARTRVIRLEGTARRHEARVLAEITLTEIEAVYVARRRSWGREGGGLTTASTTAGQRE